MKAQLTKDGVKFIAQSKKDDATLLKMITSKHLKTDFDDDDSLEDRIDEMLRRYDAASKTKVGFLIECPCCGNTQKKTTPGHKFCPNAGKCRNTYHNTVKDDRRERAKLFS